jgi:hypothetical protein
MGIATKAAKKTLKENLMKRIKAAQKNLGKNPDSKAAKDKLKDLRVEAEAELAPTPKFKADRKVDPAIMAAIKKQEEKGANIKATGDKPTAQKAREALGVDKARKATKSTTRVSNAKGNLTAAQMKTIDDAPTPTSLTSIQARMIEDINKLKKLTPAERKTRIANVRKRVADRKDKLRAAAKVKPKKEDTRRKSEKPQSSEERQRASSGRVSSTTTTQKNKKEGVGSMVAYTSLSRGKAITKAGIDLRAGKITKAQHDKIVKEINRLNAKEAPRRAGDGPKRKKQPYKPKSPFNKGGMPMVMKDGKKVPAFAADGIGKMMQGGMAKKNKKATPGYAYGGMTTSKPRTGNTDYRMGGMFMKSGKK